MSLVDIFFELVRVVLNLFSVVLIVYVVISWLYAFDIIGRRNELVSAVWRFCAAVTDPFVRPLRRLIPPIGGVDLSVMVLLILVWLLISLTYWMQSGMRIA